MKHCSSVGAGKENWLTHTGGQVRQEGRKRKLARLFVAQRALISLNLVHLSGVVSYRGTVLRWYKSWYGAPLVQDVQNIYPTTVKSRSNGLLETS